MNNDEKKKTKDRRAINAVCICIGIITSVIVAIFGKNLENSLLDKSSLVVGVWGTMLGFMITAVSVLISFKDGPFVSMLKASGHYKTVLVVFVHCCFHLLFGIIYGLIIVIFEIQGNVYFNLFCGLVADTIAMIGICLYFLLKLVFLSE